MNITETRIYDLYESVVASGFPKLPDYSEEDFRQAVQSLVRREGLSENPHFRRACRLAAARDGSGHKTFLAGVLVSANVSASNAWWLQFGRYHHQQIVSSQSKMHRLRAMLDGNAMFHPKASSASVELMFSMKDTEDAETLVYSCPMGLELTARIATNYLQLRTIWVQRKNHRLREWRDFCAWIEALPYAEELILASENRKD